MSAWDKFKTWLATSATGGLFKNAVAVVLAGFLADLTNAVPINFAEFKTYLVAAAIAVIPVIINALNSNDPRYGVNKQPGA